MYTIHFGGFALFLLGIASQPLIPQFRHQRISVGLLINGQTVSQELEDRFGTSAFRLKSWLSMVMDGYQEAKPFAFIDHGDEGKTVSIPVELEFDFTEYDTKIELPPEPDTHDVYILSGSDSSVLDEEPWIQNVLHFIKKVDQLTMTRSDSKDITPKMIGICFGHQAIHKALGGAVKAKALTHPIIGTETYQIYQMHPIMYPSDPYMPKMEKELLVLDALHSDQVTELAPMFEVIAGNDISPIGMTIKDNHILTFQAHPEYPNRGHRYVKYLLSHALDANWINEDQFHQFNRQVEEAPFPEAVRAGAWALQFIVDSNKETFQSGKTSSDIRDQNFRKVEQNNQNEYENNDNMLETLHTVNELWRLPSLFRAYLNSISTRLLDGSKNLATRAAHRIYDIA